MPASAEADRGLARRSRLLEGYRFGARLTEQGRVVSVGDGVAWVSGLPSAAMDEMIRLNGAANALVFHLARDLIGTVLLESQERVNAGTPARPSGRTLSIAVGDALLGRVIDPLGRPLDGGLPPECSEERLLEAPSPPIVERDFVRAPLYTGVKMVDALVPIAKGQRQLVIGDNGLGKTTFALDAVINQRDKGVRCVYVLIGQKRSSAVSVIETLRATGALAHTTVVVAEATDMPGLQYLAPFAGCAVAEDWMDRGHDTLIVYDDLSTHARVYRELSLLMRRPPGREAYPGDIFYLHARLLERATHLAASRGGGSMTALPIVETEEGEIAAYIPTNLISITDGQIYFDRRLFAAGMLPAIDVTRSVSRIGGQAQEAAIKREAGRTKLDYLQFLELEIFTRFGARLEASVEVRVRHGQALREALKQRPLSPWTARGHLAWLIAFNEGLLDALEPPAIAGALQRIAAQASLRDLDLAAPRPDWVAAVRQCLQGSE